MEIKASMVKDLRDKTGAGMMDAKKALVEANGDMDKAAEILRQKGIASADKKMGRIAAEGVVSTFISDKTGAMVEVNCETDFVAKNESFKEAANNIAKIIVEKNPKNVEELNGTVMSDGNTVENYIKAQIAKIGEKITIRRFVRYDNDSCVSTYVHNGKIGVLLEVKAPSCENCQSCGDDIRTIAKDICLHIASSAPEFVSREQIPSDVIAEEKRIEMGKEDLAKKPENIREKIVEGRINKLMASRCLIEQPFVKNPDITVGQLIEGKMEIVKFDRYTLGEGLEKRQDNFAEEVMSQIKG
ncbi:MAG: translation elongation factor Ts [Candidatus Gastranaerophilales bacterium]|nr:translation elongation factor Ts [Candidatus Gastranaerophilales bacterium]